MVDFLFTLIFFYVMYLIIKNAGKKNNVDWGNVGAKIENAQKVMQDISHNSSAYGDMTKAKIKTANWSNSNSSDRTSISDDIDDILEKQRLERQREIRNEQKRIDKWKASHSNSLRKTNNDLFQTSHVNKKPTNKNIRDAEAALRRCKPAVRKGWFDKGDRGKTVDRG